MWNVCAPLKLLRRRLSVQLAPEPYRFTELARISRTTRPHKLCATTREHLKAFDKNGQHHAEREASTHEEEMLAQTTRKSSRQPSSGFYHSNSARQEVLRRCPCACPILQAKGFFYGNVGQAVPPRAHFTSPSLIAGC